MTLQGSFDAFTLTDVLRFLAATAKTGCLHVDGDRGRGQVWLDHGILAGAATTRRGDDTSPLHEILFELLRYQHGSFTFSSDDISPSATTRADVDATLDLASCLLDEWRRLEAVVPSPDHRVAPARELPCAQVTIGAPLWRALVAMAAGCSVAELAQALDIGELDVTRRVHDLVDLGLVTIDPPAPSARTRRTRQPALTASP